MDKIEYGISNKFGLRLIYVDVSKTAKKLEENHLSGPVASEILGHGLLAAALLSSKIKELDERISFQLKVEGPIKGLMTEISGNGDLRGYTDIKLISDLDDEGILDMKKVMGSKGALTLIHSNEKRPLYSGRIDVPNPDSRTALARYFNQSEQIPTGIDFYSAMKDYKIDSMKGVMVQKMPDGDTEKFVHVLEKFNGREVKEHLKTVSGIHDFEKIFALDDLSLLESRSLQFNCRCSYEKTLNVLKTLSSYELQDIIKQKTPQRVTCHFCGETYKVKTEDVSTLLLEKADENKPV